MTYQVRCCQGAGGLDASERSKSVGAAPEWAQRSHLEALRGGSELLRGQRANSTRGTSRNLARAAIVRCSSAWLDYMRTLTPAAIAYASPACFRSSVMRSITSSLLL